MSGKTMVKSTYLRPERQELSVVGDQWEKRYAGKYWTNYKQKKPKQDDDKPLASLK
jgi:hypothetical protein